MKISQICNAKYQGGVVWNGQVAVWEVFLEMGFGRSVGFGLKCQCAFNSSIADSHF